MRAGYKVGLLSALFVLSACGVDTVTATATAAKLKAEEVKAGKQQLERAEQKLDAINQLGTRRLENADNTDRSSEDMPDEM